MRQNEYVMLAILEYCVNDESLNMKWEIMRFDINVGVCFIVMLSNFASTVFIIALLHHVYLVVNAIVCVFFVA